MVVLTIGSSSLVHAWSCACVCALARCCTCVCLSACIGKGLHSLSTTRTQADEMFGAPNTGMNNYAFQDCKDRVVLLLHPEEITRMEKEFLSKYVATLNGPSIPRWKFAVVRRAASSSRIWCRLFLNAASHFHVIECVNVKQVRIPKIRCGC